MLDISLPIFGPFTLYLGPKITIPVCGPSIGGVDAVSSIQEIESSCENGLTQEVVYVCQMSC